MKKTSGLLTGVFAVTAAFGVGIGMWKAKAADHAEAPAASADPAADIADFYAWHTDNDTIVAVVTIAGAQDPGIDAVYDGDVLYGIHIDNNGDSVADIDVWARFGQNDMDAYGLKVENLPGTSGPIMGPVGMTHTGANNTRIYAGLRDDPFFFDQQGFGETLMTGELSFMNSRDTIATKNATAIVVEMDTAAALNSADDLRIWATTGRIDL